MRYLLAMLLISLTVSAADWPQWRGPNRDGLSSETGLLTAWPAGGPRVLWKTTGFGRGWSSLAIANGRVYTQGQRGDYQYVFAFDAQTGKKLWETPTTSRYDRRGADEGPRGTPTVDGACLYAMAVDGVLACLEAATGKIIWSQNVAQKYDGSVIYADKHLYALSEDGVMSLVEATPQAYKEVSRFDIDIGPRPSFCPFFALPAISDGKLYVRIWDNLLCYDIKAR